MAEGNGSRRGTGRNEDMNWPDDFIATIGVDPYYSDKAGIIYCGDCLEILPKISDKSVDLVLTDPPYGTGGRDGSTHLVDENISGNRMSVDSYVWMVKQYSSGLHRLSMNDSHCYIFSDWRRYKDIQIGCENSHWELRSLIVWDKGNGMGEYWRSSHEFILFLTKTKPRKLNQGGCYNVLRYPSVKTKQHPAQKPIDLIIFMTETSSRSDGLVLDPFLGSGTTAVAAKRLGRRYIGIEINPDYCKIAAERLSQEQLL